MSITKFYAGRSLFITGGSGFIGKQVIEKLLRSHIDRIYVLMRANKAQSAQQRLQQMLQTSEVCLYYVHISFDLSVGTWFRTSWK